MLKNYFKISLRNILKYKMFSFINIIGLSVGMAASLIMLMYVVDADSYDKHHDNYENIYRISTIWKSNDNPMKFAGSMSAISPALNEKYSDIKAARIVPVYKEVEFNVDNRIIKEDKIIYADPTFFNVFSYKFVEGTAKDVLMNPYSVVITERAAIKYFGNLEALNKVLIFGEHQIKVTGIIENPFPNTHINADLFISYSTIEAIDGGKKETWNNWGDASNYVMLNEHVKLDMLKQRMDDLIKTRAGDWFVENIEMVYQPLADIHWISGFMGDTGPKDDKMNLYIFLTAAVIILIIACFNFMNLTMARFAERLKEIGVRKVIGANRAELIKQFIVESFVITLLSISIGVLLFELINSSLYSFFDKQIAIGEYHFIYFGLIVVFMILLVGLVTGSYPAFYFSKFQPVETIKNRSLQGSKGFAFRKVLVVAQFVFSIMLIFCTSVIFKQINFAQNMDLGYDKDNVILLRMGSKEALTKYQLLKESLSTHSGIKAVSGAYTVAGIKSRETVSLKILGSEEQSASLQAIGVDFDYVDAISTEIVRGRNFSEEFSTDSEESVIINERAVKEFNLTEPIGKQISFPAAAETKIVNIIGVVKDYQIQSIHNAIPPMILYINPQRFYNMLVKYNPEEGQEVKAFINKTWSEILPYDEIRMTTLDNSYKKLYQSEEKTSGLLLLFSIFAIFISVLGLFGLTSFTISKKVKEIGVRKVLGASVVSIVMQLGKSVAGWIIVSIIIALPVAHLLMNKWLQNFAYKTSIPVWIYLLAAGLVFVIAMITVSVKSAKAAVANPVESLRNE